MRRATREGEGVSTDLPGEVVAFEQLQRGDEEEDEDSSQEHGCRPPAEAEFASPISGWVRMHAMRVSSLTIRPSHPLIVRLAEP